MITNKISVEFKSVEEAPNYNKEPNLGFKPVALSKLIVVKNGMQSGKDSYDLQLVDAEGNKYLAFVTGGILDMILASTGRIK